MDPKLLEERRKKLQKTDTKETVVDLSKTYESLRENKEKAEGTNMEKWFDSLKDTDAIIAATLIPFPLEEGKALVKAYEVNQMKKGTLSEEDSRNLDNLATRIETEGKKAFPDMSSKGFFVRLNTRSPKDGRIFSKLMFDSIKSDCELLEKQGKTVDDNAKLSVIYTNFVKKMIVYSGKEAVELLSNSHRIWQDITSTIDTIIDKFEMYVVIREWVGIHPSMEFRGFVYNHQLNAISSYNRAVCWPGIPERRNEIEERCRAYWEKIKDKLPKNLPNFIVDFAFLEDSNKVTIVEFNDFADFEGCGANAELFDWQKDADVLQGKKPFETRLVMEPLSREQLEKTLTKPFKIHLGWVPLESWVPGVDYY